MENNNQTISKAKLEFEAGRLDQCEVLLNQLLENDQSNVDVLLLKAKVLHKKQKWGEALNHLNRILDIDGQNTEAQTYRQMVMSIVGFWRKENYNP